MIIAALDDLGLPVVLPLHPRTRDRLRRLGLSPRGSLRIRPPVPYLEMLLLESEARAILTDSGGIQKEAFILQTPCITLRERTEWSETVAAKANRLVGTNPRKIAAAVRSLDRWYSRGDAARHYGGGRASERIEAEITRFLQRHKR
jgi:UDP-N-acetylglucosamine 2-epimerase